MNSNNEDSLLDGIDADAEKSLNEMLIGEDGALDKKDEDEMLI